MESKSTVIWQGSIKEGEGKITTESGTLNDSKLSYGTRFEHTPGTNPEELIAAAHAGCFSMALTDQLSEAGLTPESIETVASLTLNTESNEFEITKAHLNVTAKIPGADPKVFEKAANTAKESCPVSKVLNADITMDARLES